MRPCSKSATARSISGAPLAPGAMRRRTRSNQLIGGRRPERATAAMVLERTVRNKARARRERAAVPGVAAAALRMRRAAG